MEPIDSTDGVTLAVHDLGGLSGQEPECGDGVPALLAHATGFHGMVWAPVARSLTGLRCWAPDLRGHGDSPAPEHRGFDWEGFADDVLAVVDALSLERPVGVGHSKGGASLLLAEQRRPGTFRSLYCYEPVVFSPELTNAGDETSNPLAESARRRRDRFDSYDAAIANFASKPPLSVLRADALEAYVRYGFAEQPDGSVVLKCRPADEAQVYAMGSRHRAWDGLAEVTCPVTIARGHLGDPGPAAHALAIAERLPGGRLEVFDELGHFGPMEDPDRVAGAIRDAVIPPA